MFTIAVVAMVASLTFAQLPLAKKKTASANKLEQLVDMKTLAKEAKQVKEMKAAMAEKAAAAKEESSSVLRKNSVKHGFFQNIEGKVINTWTLGGYRSASSGKPYKSTARKTTTQEGNVTVTTDAHGIITDVAGVAPKYYQRAATGTAYYPSNNQMAMGSQSGTVTVIEDGDNVYIKNPITRYTTGAWVKGAKSGNVITVAARQPLDYDADYNATASLRWAVITTAGKIQAADEYAPVFTFTVDGDVLTLEGTVAFTGEADAYYMGLLWDDDNSNGGYGDAETVLTYDPTYVAPSTEPVTLPAGAAPAEWYMNCVSVSNSDETPVNNQKVNVAFVDNDVYVQGISEDFPSAWVKGTIDGNNITFAKFQYAGQYGSYDCWFIGVDATGEAAVIKDAVATYDAGAKTITFKDEVLFNAAEDRVYYLNWYSDVVLSAEEKEIVEPVITELTADLPYKNTFDTEEERAQAAIYDANNDKSTFTIEEHSTTKSMVARYRYSTTNKADDYLVFPGVALEAGKKYKVSVDAASNGISYVERVEVLAGKKAQVSQLTIPVIAATEVTAKEFTTLRNAEFTVSEDGTYYIAVHAISDPNKFYLFVDNFSISEIDQLAPATVDDLNVVADAQGANKATVTFSVPAKKVNGDDITEDVKVVVERNAEKIYSETKAARAEVVIADDNVPSAGDYTYTVTAYCGDKVGESASVKVYVGYDTPDIVSNITIADKSGSVDLSWDAPTKGANGYVINPADFTYDVYPVDIMEFFGMQIPVTDYANPYVTGLKETSANVAYDTNSGEHGFTYFAVTTSNTTGRSDDAYASVVTGAPYQMPVFESVAGGELSYWWGIACDANNNSLQGGMALGENASDGDGGCFLMAAKTAGWINLQSGKIALAGTVNPTLTFDYAADAATPLTVTVITPKGKKKIADLAAGTSYAKAEISLAEYTNEDWVRVIIEGTFTAACNAYLDNIRVFNMIDNNLVAKGIAAKGSITAGEDVKVTVTVENQGTKAAAAGAYTVDLYCNDTKVQSLPGTELASNAQTSFEFTEKTTVMTPSELVWKAIVEFADDNDKSNNTTNTVKTVIKTNNYPVVTDLAGMQTDNGLRLTWSEPDMGVSAPVIVTDDFESYDGFTSSAGEWTFVDGDGAQVGGFQGKDFNVDGTPMSQSLRSFWVHDVSDGDTWNQTFAAHSGIRYLASMYRADDGQVDDWAISPVLSGNAQTISFYARSYSSEYPEKIEVLYSTGSKDTKDFISVKPASVVPGEWTEYTAELPEGAKYFAIRSCAEGSFMLMIDDAKYETIEGFGDLAIVGYNVYRDGVKLNSEPVAETVYVDADAADGEHSYVVTVVYDKGESKVSNVVTVDVTNGIAGIAGKSMRIFTAGKAIVVENANGENVSVYTVDGKAVYNAAGTETDRVRVESGVYIVKVGKTVMKTVVR